MHRALYKHLDKYLPAEQSGFRQKDGTKLQLGRLVHDITLDSDDHQHVYACFFDLSKAFDRVWHAGLLKKLEQYGVRGQALQWLTHYLTDRRERVHIATATSPWLSIPAGVLQGSVLSPLLFLAYTIDLPSACAAPNSRCSLFADDTAVVASHPSSVESEAHLHFIRCYGCDMGAHIHVVLFNSDIESVYINLK